MVGELIVAAIDCIVHRSCLVESCFGRVSTLHVTSDSNAKMSFGSSDLFFLGLSAAREYAAIGVVRCEKV